MKVKVCIILRSGFQGVNLSITASTVIHEAFMTVNYFYIGFKSHGQDVKDLLNVT